MKKINDVHMELIIINTKKYFARKYIGAILSILSILIGGAIFARGSQGSFLSLYIDIPFVLELIIYVFVAVLFVSGLIVSFYNEVNQGKIIFSKKRININGVESDLSSSGVVIYLNPCKQKNVYVRSIGDQGGNNWIKIINDNAKKEVEFLLKSQKQEDELKGLIKSLQDNGLNIVLKKSPRSLKDKWGDF